jgi:hypothetical protein
MCVAFLDDVLSPVPEAGSPNTQTSAVKWVLVFVKVTVLPAKSQAGLKVNDAVGAWQ